MVMFFFRESKMLLTSQRSQIISSPETHSVQSSSHRPCQQPIWVLMSEMKTFMWNSWLTDATILLLWVWVLPCSANYMLMHLCRSSKIFPCVCVGPVHVHNPGTVIFSLLSEFTGQVGPTVEGGKTAERVASVEEDERDCPVCHPTSSPSIHLSEEERSRETDSIFFPSQEQGKDCHVSKEEELWYVAKLPEDLCWWLWTWPSTHSFKGRDYKTVKLQMSVEHISSSSDKL